MKEFEGREGLRTQRPGARAVARPAKLRLDHPAKSPQRGLSTGREAAMNLHHYFRFRDGKIAYYRGSEDTAQTLAALTG